MRFEAVIVQAVPLVDQVHLRCEAVLRITQYEDNSTHVISLDGSLRDVLPIRDFPRYEIARDFLPVVSDADERFLTVLRTHPAPFFGLVKFAEAGGGICPDCRGSGEYRGLRVIEACIACHGSGGLASLPSLEQRQSAEDSLKKVMGW